MSFDYREELRRAAGSCPTGPDIRRIQQRGELLRRRRRAVSAIGAIVLCAAIWGVLGNVAIFEEANSTRGQAPEGNRNIAAAASPTSTTEESDGCNFAPVRPTYLPWLEPSREIPAPEKSDPGPGSGSADLTWFKPTETAPFYVSLRQSTESTQVNPSPPANPVPVWIHNVQGDLEVIASGDVAITWAAPLDDFETCNFVVLELTTSGRLSTQEAKEEVIKVAESFRSG